MSRLRFRRRGRPPHPDVLTPAEWRVLGGVREGLSNAEIADRLGISANTVRYHVSNMLSKLSVADRQALAAWRGQPAEVHAERHRALLGLAFVRSAVVAVLVALAALLAWVALDRLSGETGEVPAATAEGTAAPTEVTPTPDAASFERVRGTDVPFVESGRYWARTLQTSSTSLGSPQIVVAPNGDLLVATTASAFEALPGAYAVAPANDPLVGAGSYDIVLARYTADGSPIWGRLFGGPEDDLHGGMALAQDGDILLTGVYEDGFDLGDGPMPGVGRSGGGMHGTRDGFIARLDATGQLRWVRTFGSPETDGAGAVVELADGGIVALGWSSASAIDVGDARLESDQDRQSFAMGLSADGAFEWVTPLGSSYAAPIAVDEATDDVVIARSERADDRGLLSLRGLTRLSPAGDEVWRTAPLGSLELELRPLTVAGLAIDEDGTIVIAGRFEGDIDLGGGILTSRGFDPAYESNPLDGYLARFGSDGSHLMSRGLGKPDRGVEALALDDDGDILIAGHNYVERLDRAGDSMGKVRFRLSVVDPAGIPPSEQAYIRSSSGPERLGTLLVDTAATEDGEILIGGRFFDRLVLPFGERLLTTHWLDHFLARIEAP